MPKSVLPLFLLCILLATPACDDAIRWEVPAEPSPTPSAGGLYILCEGLFNRNNSLLAYYDLRTGLHRSFIDDDLRGSDKTSYDMFKQANGRKLGDTANDLQRYGNHLWCAVSVSSQVEVMDVSSGRSLRQIPLFTEEGVGRQPRCFAFDGGKAYVCNFDGTVARIDTATLCVDGLVHVGRNPDGICTAAGKLYVSNSGGLDTTHPDSTVSVVDLDTFAEVRRLTVRKNPGAIHADGAGNVYVVSRGRYDEGLADYDPRLHRIDSHTDEVVETFDYSAVDFCINGSWAYLYGYGLGGGGIRVMDTRTGRIVDTDFVKDGTPFVHVYALAVDPSTGYVYVADAQHYTTPGLIYAFTPQGQCCACFEAKGLNPNSLVFWP